MAGHLRLSFNQPVFFVDAINSDVLLETQQVFSTAIFHRHSIVACSSEQNCYTPQMRKLKVAGLFAGIGGVELGLHRSGHQTKLLCEFDPGAAAVLAEHFPSTELVGDVRNLDSVPLDIDLLAAGFPCQDLSQAGKTEGISGDRSGLVGEVFRILDSGNIPSVLLENVPFMLQLNKGNAMRFIAHEFEKRGYHWAYRVVDSRSFGLPQRRQRVFFLASKELRPEKLLFQQDAGSAEPTNHEGYACGFYWTEGLRGLGWAIDSVPTIKGGSTIGIASPPAIWFPDGRIEKPSIEDVERLQGFEAGWTIPAQTVAKAGHRWKLVGNAVSVPTAEWIGRALLQNPKELEGLPLPFDEFRSWPKAAFGNAHDGRFEVEVSAFPVRRPRPTLIDFLKHETTPLSLKAVKGFLSRLGRGNLRYPDEFLKALLAHSKRMEEAESLQFV